MNIRTKYNQIFHREFNAYEQSVYGGVYSVWFDRHLTVYWIDKADTNAVRKSISKLNCVEIIINWV